MGKIEKGEGERLGRKNHFLLCQANTVSHVPPAGGGGHVLSRKFVLQSEVWTHLLDEKRKVLISQYVMLYILHMKGAKNIKLV